MTARQAMLTVSFLIGGCLTARAAEPPVIDPALDQPLAWPEVTSTVRPWTFWWWMGSAVDSDNLSRALHRFRDAGFGGVHIIPIYEAKGFEDRSIAYLSPRWLEMLRHTVGEARRLGLDVDMTLGTGWCFGGPNISERDANARVVVKTTDVPAGGRITQRFDRDKIQALVASSSSGQIVDLIGRIGEDGALDWTAGDGPCRVTTISQRFSGQKVKRAAPGGEGPMLNPFSRDAIRHYLPRFTEAFASYGGPTPRAIYQDSYEYQSDWSPDLFEQFERRRGYRLQDHLPSLFGKEADDQTARVKHDYRATISDLMVEDVTPTWVGWGHERGLLSRNQAHGSPGNLLDLYAAADIPETEMFSKDRNPLVAKLASSAAHVAGRRLTSSETGTWLAEHFTVKLGDLKRLVDEFFVSGINHVFYHGTCYSPDEAAWPGWLFYALTDMNPRQAIWRDAPALNAYIARCQSILQSNRPDNEILLYWPIADLWHDPEGLLKPLAIHNDAWLMDQPVGRASQWLWDRGFSFDYLSDRQLARAQPTSKGIELPGGTYRTVIVPPCDHIPLETLEALLRLARGGSTVIFQDHLPGDVPGLADLDRRRTTFRKLMETVKFGDIEGGLRHAAVGKGSFLVGDLEPALAQARVVREPMVDHPGVRFVRRRRETGRDYFIINQGDQPLDGWIILGEGATSIVAMDPMTGRSGLCATRHLKDQTQAYLQLPPGGSILWRTFTSHRITGPDWPYDEPSGKPIALEGTWRVAFLDGGPVLPAPFEAKALASWTTLGDDEARRFAGTALYTLTFNGSSRTAQRWSLDLGTVCQSARVRLNGRDLGTRFLPPFCFAVDALKPADNVLEVEVTNLSANRIRDLDRRGVSWKNFHDINFVSISYKPFDASDWPLQDSGLLGPVTLTPLTAMHPAGNAEPRKRGQEPFLFNKKGS